MSDFEIIFEQQTPKVPEITNHEEWIKENKDELFRFLEFFVKTKKAAGLAANQVSYKGKRLMGRYAIIATTDGVDIAVDPELVSPSTSDGIVQKEYIEGCLTWPNSLIRAMRWPKVTVKYYNFHGKIRERDVEDEFESQVWQHEINHLNGVEEIVVPKDFLTIRRKEPKIGRNDICSCGSNRKYKKCCGKK